ncbi:MAG: hypothetical protein Q9216_004792 [Gyalolechia sp. 2 TL-2023]
MALLNHDEMTDMIRIGCRGADEANNMFERSYEGRNGARVQLLAASTPATDVARVDWEKSPDYGGRTTVNNVELRAYGLNKT